MLSKGKGPGVDCLVDKVIHEDPEIREQVFNYVEKVFNQGQNITEDLKIGKLMLLSKTNSTNPLASDTRPIVILNTTLKLI